MLTVIIFLLRIMFARESGRSRQSWIGTSVSPPSTDGRLTGKIIVSEHQLHE